TSQPQTATLTNTGTGPLGNISVSSGSDFPTTHDCPISLAPGASCTISITFMPTYLGTEYGYINVFNDSPYSASIFATGTGLAPVPTVTSLSPASAAAGSTD